LPHTGAVVPLGHGARGLRGVVVQVGVPVASDLSAALAQGELERRLLEIGFVEGAQVEILHEGLIGRDPIGVRLDDMCVALRRREADAVLVRVQDAFAEAAIGSR
jgi:ferrous iron transport protein A